MPSCTSCGMEIPEGQGSSCSMCYGDIDYGRDGYYRAWAEAMDREGERQYQELAEQEKREQQEADEPEKIDLMKALVADIKKREADGE